MSQRNVDPHLGYTKEQIAKNLILLEEHFKSYQCPVCINKHLLAIEGYAEEGVPMSHTDAPLFIEIAGWARNARTAKQLNALRMIEQARDLRQKCQEVSHDEFHQGRVHCHGAQCHAAEEHELVNG